MYPNDIISFGVMQKSMELCVNIESLESAQENGVSVEQIEKINNKFIGLQEDQHLSYGVHSPSVKRFIECTESKVNQFFKEHTVLVKVTFNAGENRLAIRGVNGQWDTDCQLNTKNKTEWTARIPRPTKNGDVTCKLICQSPNSNSAEWQPDPNIKVVAGKNLEIFIVGSNINDFKNSNNYTLSYPSSVAQSSHSLNNNFTHFSPIPTNMSNQLPNNNPFHFNPTNISNQSPISFQQPVAIHPPQQIFSGTEQQNILALKNRAQQQGYISFYTDQIDSLTGFLGNFHPCRIEFGGKLYSNSEAVFQAQKFIDQPVIFNQFNSTLSGSEAVKLGQSKMNINRLNQWEGTTNTNNPPEKINVMKNALRAKFNQNPILKTYLMATGSSCLIEHLPSKRRDVYWSDAFDGTGKNMLGICLMELRAEFGGTGVVPRPQAYEQMLISTGAKSVQVNSNQSGLMCMMDKCTKAVYLGFKFCGKTHGQEYMSLHGRCAKCEQPKYSEKDNQGNITKTHDYCSRTCANNK